MTTPFAQLEVMQKSAADDKRMNEGLAAILGSVPGLGPALSGTHGLLGGGPGIGRRIHSAYGSSGLTGMGQLAGGAVGVGGGGATGGVLSLLLKALSKGKVNVNAGASAAGGAILGGLTGMGVGGAKGSRRSAELANEG